MCVVPFGSEDSSALDWLREGWSCSDIWMVKIIKARGDIFQNYFVPKKISSEIKIDDESTKWLKVTRAIHDLGLGLTNHRVLNK